jgi:HEAT repeat protein
MTLKSWHRILRKPTLSIALLAALSAFDAPRVVAQTSTLPTEGLKSTDAKIRAKTARELGQSGDSSVIPALVDALKDPDPKVRSEVVVALATLRQPPALDALTTVMKDPDVDVRGLAIEGMVGYYTGETPSTGFAGFMKKYWERAKSRFSPDTTQVDPGIALDPKVVNALREGLADTASARIERESARGLGVLHAKAAVPDLVKAAHSGDVDLSRESLSALAKIGDTSAGPELVDLLDSADNGVRLDDAVTLGILRTHDALPKLQSLYASGSDHKTMEKALEGLAYLGDPVSVPLFLKALWSTDKSLRISAAEGLARAGNAEALPDLLKAAGSERDAEARLAMEFALTALGRNDYLAEMVDELGSNLQGDVAQSYFVELTRRPGFLAVLYPYLDHHNPAVRKRLCDVLMYSGDSSSLAPLERLSRDSNNDVAGEALRALRAIRARSAA